MKAAVFSVLLQAVVHGISAPHDFVFDGLRNAPSSFQCDFGYKLDILTDQCYRLYQPANYREALETCTNDGGNLASIHDLLTDKSVSEKAAEVLVGLRLAKQTLNEAHDGSEENVNPDVGSLATPVDLTEVTMRWSDGSSVDYLRNENTLKTWHPYFGECVAVTPSGWKNVQCNRKLPFLCQKRVDRFCGAGYQNFDGKCYAIHEREELFEDAERRCISEGGHLASVHSEPEAVYLARLGGDGMKLLGFDSDHFTDGSDTSFITAKEIEREACIRWKEPRYNDGSAEFEDCSWSLKPFICQKPVWYTTDRSCPLSNIFGGSATVTSPGHPRPYRTAQLLECSYFFAAKNGHLGRVIFDEFDLGTDYILVYEGWNASSKTPIGIVRKHSSGAPMYFATENSNLLSMQFVGRTSGIWKAHFESFKRLEEKPGEEKEDVSSLLCTLLRPQLQSSNSSDQPLADTSSVSSAYKKLCSNFQIN